MSTEQKSVPTVLLDSCSVILGGNSLKALTDSLEKINNILDVAKRIKRSLEKKVLKMKKKIKISFVDCKTLGQRCPRKDRRGHQKCCDAMMELEKKMVDLKKNKSSENNSERNGNMLKLRKLMRLLRRLNLPTYNMWKDSCILWHQNIPYAVTQDQKQTHLIRVTRLAILRPSTYYCMCGGKTGYYEKEFCPVTKKWTAKNKPHCGKGDSCTVLEDMVLKAMESGKL